MPTPLDSNSILNLINTSRQQAGLAPFVSNPTLVKAAQAKADDMTKRGYFDHVDPDGTRGWQLIGKNGYSYNTAGENLAEGFQDAESTMNAWMNSPTHKANIISPNFKETGVVVVPGVLNGRQTNFVVQMFADPMTGKPVTSVKPVAKSTAKSQPKKQVKKPLPKTKLGQKSKPNVKGMITKTYLGMK
jgi:uncharacterized protein YkwD